MNKSAIIISAGIGIFLITVCVLIINAIKIPTGIRTQGNIVIIKGIIEEYEEKHGKLPDSLEDFRKFNRNTDITKDEWGNQIMYIVDSEGLITLKSLGRDGKPEGKGGNLDITLRFKTGDSVVMPFDTEREE